MTQRLEVFDEGVLLSFSFDEMLRYAGPGSPAGVALAFKAMELAFPLLVPAGPLDRRRVVVETAFRGPGARDGIELVTRALTDGRYLVDAALERPERGTTLEQFVFRPRYGDRSVTLLVREGQVTDEFVAMARKPDRTADDERHFTALKQGMADRVMAGPPADVFEVESE
ncbi:MAG TPA: hypothetical protein VM942_00460 [Acidimicrobiales bacterium]|nr:hypothetical protein [Acidimicrobiales bacterium]